MPNAEAAAMHTEFPRWYREVGIDENRERLQRRWTAVSKFVAGMADLDIENALRIVFRASGSTQGPGVERIRKVFKEADELFDMQGNNREMEVLCAASVAVLMEGHGDLAASAALRVTTSELHGTRHAELPMPLGSLAEGALARISEAHRKRPDLPKEVGDLPKLAFTTSTEKVQQQFDEVGVAAAFDLAAATVNTVLQTVDARLRAIVYSTSSYIAIQDEELNMLWWLFGERSEDLDQPFKDVPAKAQPLVFAKELADATQYLPGPISTRGLLARAGLKDSRKVSVVDAINECNSSWLKVFMAATNVSPLTQPIHFAIQRKLETNDDTSWVAGWATICGVEEKLSIPALSLGTLFYRERLLSLFR